MDIRKRKSRIVSHKKRKKAVPPKRIIPEVQKKLEIIDPTIIAPISEPAGNYLCINKCGAEVANELERCGPCETSHKKLAEELDAKPRQVIEKVPEKWVYYKQVQGGVVVTIRMTEQEAAMTGKKITKEVTDMTLEEYKQNVKETWVKYNLPSMSEEELEKCYFKDKEEQKI